MPSGLPTPNACCSTCPTSDEEGGSNIPGPQGPAGADGADGTDGVNAYTTLTSGFTQPASGSNVTIAVANTSWMAVGQNVFIRSGGDYEVISIGSATAATVKNLGYPNNAAAAASVANSSQVTPSGQRGAAGADGSSASIPLTTKGDLLTYDTANTRLGVGSNGQVLMADSGQATGLIWKTVYPASSTDNAIARYDGTTGRLIQNSNITITDDGAIQSTGGNARGSKAVDLQIDRADAAQVASGDNSFIGGGSENKASADKSVVCGGQTNTSSDTNCFVGGGEANLASDLNASVVAGSNNEATAEAAFIGGGSSNEASAQSASVVAGEGNAASGQFSFIGGGLSNTTSGQYASVIGGFFGVADKFGQISHAAGVFASGGDAQTSELIWRNATTDGTATELFLDGSAARATIPADSTWCFHGHVVGRSDTGDSASWEFSGTIKNNAGSTTLSASVTPTLISADSGITGTWGQASNVAVTANDTQDALKIAVTGAGSTNIRWVAHARIVEVKY